MSAERSTNGLDHRIGQRVRMRRLEIGMSQQRLAALLEVTFQQVQKYEKGVNRIAASRLFAIAAALDMPVAGFFDISTSQEGSSSIREEILATPEGAHLAALFASIKSAKVRRRVVELVRAITEG